MNSTLVLHMTVRIKLLLLYHADSVSLLNLGAVCRRVARKIAAAIIIPCLLTLLQKRRLILLLFLQLATKAEDVLIIESLLQ